MKIDKTHSFLNLLVDIEFGADLLALFAIFADTAECNSTTLKSCNNGQCRIQNHEAVCVCDEGKFFKIIIRIYHHWINHFLPWIINRKKLRYRHWRSKIQCQHFYIPMVTQSLALLPALLNTNSDNHMCYYQFSYIPMVTQSLVLLSALLYTYGNTITCAVVSFATCIPMVTRCQLCYLPMVTQSLVLLLPTEAVLLSWSHSLQDVCASRSW